MLTDEKIEEIAEEFIVDVGNYLETAIPEHLIVDFARKLLSEVRLEDMLKREEAFVKDNMKSFKDTFDFCSENCVVYYETESAVAYGGYKRLHISWEDYNNWKQTIEAVSDA